MQDKKKEIIDCINDIYIAQNKYITEDADRTNLCDIIKFIRSKYENHIMSKSFLKAKYYKLFLLLILEKIKQTVLFENKIVKVIEEEFETFCKNVYAISNETKKIIDYKPLPQKVKKEFSLSNHLSIKAQKPKSKRSNYPQKISKMLKRWLEENVNHPYPSEAEKAQFCEKTGLDVAQINNWFINARRRILPFIKGKYTDCE